MASVQYLINLIQSFPEELRLKQESFMKDADERYYYATLIQKTWRGFKTRKQYLQILKAIKTIQSYFRGWMVRKRRDYFEEVHKEDLYNLRLYKAAVIIQSNWRGYITRKYLRGKCVKQRVAERKQLLQINQQMQEMIKEKFRENAKLEEDENEDFYRRKVMFILFKCHHLIRTFACEGVYSCHNSNNLSIIEQLMKALPLKNYMREVRKVYYEEVNKLKGFTQNLQGSEDLLEVENNALDNNSTIHEKTFELTSKICRLYQKPILTSGKYTKAIDCVEHNENIKAKNLTPEGFILKPKISMISKDIPYFIDFWEKNCSQS